MFPSQINQAILEVFPLNFDIDDEELLADLGGEREGDDDCRHFQQLS